MSLSQFIKPTQLKFEKRVHIVDNVYSFTFQPMTHLDWRAGQHGMLEIELASGKTSRRMFSLSSAPGEHRVTITTRWHGKSASDYKQALWGLMPGDKASIRGPVGPMYIRDTAANNVLIAGGIGITPLFSIVKQATLSSQPLRATLLYANKSPDTVIFKDELVDMSQRLHGLSVDFIYSPAEISPQSIKQHVSTEPTENSYFYLSGPPAMIKTYRKILRDRGVSRGRIYSDPFMGYK